MIKLKSELQADSIIYISEIDFNRDSAPYESILSRGIEILDMEIGIISKIKNDNYIISSILPTDIGFSIGDNFNLKDTYCQSVISSNSIISYENVGSDPIMNKHPIYISLSLESYIGAPIYIDNEIYGTISFSSKKRRKKHFDENDFSFIKFMSKIVGHALKNDQIINENKSLQLINEENLLLLSNAFKYAPIGMAIVSPEGSFVRVNKSLIAMLGYKKEELLSLNFRDITHPDDLENDLAHLEKLVSREINSYKIEKRYIKKDGDSVWVLLCVSAIFKDKKPVFFLSQIQNITDDKAANEEINHLNKMLQNQANYDYLTNLENRRKFSESFNEVLAQNYRNISFAIIDVDYFKDFNDTFGHSAGDEVLIFLSQTMKKVINTPESHISRFGGEEFTILLPNLNKEECINILEYLRESIEHLSSIVLPRKITVSIGAITFTSHVKSELSLDVLTIISDEMLYKAKHSGRNNLKHKEFYF